MSVIHMEMVGQQTIDRATKLLAGIDGGIERALKGASSRAVSYLRSNTVKEIQKKYAVSAANIRANENVTIKYTYQNGVQAFVNFHGYKIPLYRYNGTSPTQPTLKTDEWVSTMIAGKWRRVHPGMAASGHPLKGTSPEQFQNVFVSRMSSGHVGLFERTGGATSKGSDAIQEKMGSSVPQMLGSKEVERTLSDATAQKFRERLDHEVLRILNGWGD